MFEVEIDPAGQLADFSALVDGVEDPLDAVVLHREEEARESCGLGVPALKSVGVAWVYFRVDIAS